MDAVMARFHDYRTVKTKSVCHLIFEIPIEQVDAVVKCLGGTPQPGREQWVGIAPIRELDNGGDREKRDNPQHGDAFGATASPSPPADEAPSIPSGRGPHAPAQTAPAPSDPAKAAVTSCAIRCREKQFQDWVFHEAMKREIPIGECGQRDDECARLVRLLLGVESRSEIGKNDLVRARWRKLEAQFNEHVMLELRP
jgi:hypothetical protein